MRWRMLAMLFAARIGLGLQFQTLGSVSDDLVIAFGLDYASIGLLIGLFMVPGLFLALPAGYSGRYVSDRVLAVSGLCVLAAGGFISSVAPDSWTIGLGRMLAGAGFLIINLYFTKMVADWFEGREIATAMSILVMSWPFGIAMGQVGHTWLAEAYGWRVPFAVASLYCAVAALAVFVLYRAPNDLPSLVTNRTRGLLPREWALIACAGVAWGVFNAGYVVYLSFGPALLEAQGMTTLAAASVISAGSWLMILSGAACGQIVDRFGRREVILTVCMAGAIMSLMLLSIPGAGLAASLLFGLLGMAPAGVIMALAGQAVAPERRAFGMGLFFTIYFAIMAAGAPVAGWIIDRTGAPGDAILFGAVLFALVLPVAVLFRIIKTKVIPVPFQENA